MEEEHEFEKVTRRLTINRVRSQVCRLSNDTGSSPKHFSRNWKLRIPNKVLRGTLGDTWSFACLLAQLMPNNPTIYTEFLHLSGLRHISGVGGESSCFQWTWSQCWVGWNEENDGSKVRGPIIIFPNSIYSFFLPLCCPLLYGSLSAFCLIDTKMKATTRYKIENLEYLHHTSHGNSFLCWGDAKDTTNV